MTAAARTIAFTGLPDSAEERRAHLVWGGVLQTVRGPVPCRVADLSRGGARLSVAADIAVGQAVTLVVTGIGTFRGAVIWADTGELGLAFAAPANATAA
ncbi:MAG TPA: PilZ domain-containing protein [Stellaceae bacterium]|nr:PilZ domain-containing protein [Stellaceae bacterium]